MKSNKFVRGIFGLILSCFVICGITSCTPPSGSQVATQITYLDAVEGVPDSFLGTWENNDNGYHSEYTVSKAQINDGMSNVLYNVVSTSTVTTTDGYTLVFCQVAEGSGTPYTPAGNYYVVGLKLSGDNLAICCPLDYSSVYKTLGSLTKKYTSAFTYAGSGNYDSVCTKMTAASQAITLTDSTGFMTQVKFEKTKVTLLMIKASGWEEYTSFTPVRDTSKENSSTLLYLYSSADRTYGSGDNHYMKINSDGSIYWYEYDEDEDDNDTTIDLCNEYMPTVSSENLAAIKALYE